MSLDVHFSSRSPVWETPETLFRSLDAEFHFTVDVCALPENAKCESFYTPEQDGLSRRWEGVAWMNPPYGKEIVRWVKKAYLSAQDGCVVVCLLPARTDTRWWHDYVMLACEVRLVRGRLRFSGHRNAAPFPSAVVVFRPARRRGVARFSAVSAAGEPDARCAELWRAVEAVCPR